MAEEPADQGPSAHFETCDFQSCLLWTFAFFLPVSQILNVLSQPVHIEHFDKVTQGGCVGVGKYGQSY